MCVKYLIGGVFNWFATGFSTGFQLVCNWFSIEEKGRMVGASLENVFGFVAKQSLVSAATYYLAAGADVQNRPPVIAR